MKTWKDLPGYFDFADLYEQRVAAAIDGAVFVEIGIYHGRSLVYMADLIRASGKAITLHGVDNFQCPSIEQFAAGLAECGDYSSVNIITGDSAESAKQFEDGSVDFAFIDADHAYESVKRDIKAWRSKIRPGGIIAGHDRIRKSVSLAVIESLGHYAPIGPLSWMVQL